MRTAIDTNVLFAIWSGEPSASGLAAQLGELKSDGALLIAPVVYSELLAHPKATEAFVNEFLADTGVSVAFELRQEAWLEAGRRFARYAERRRRSSHGSPKRLLADFIVGAHALVQADRLITRDASRYAQDFPELRLL